MVDYYGTWRSKCNACYHLDNALTDSSGNANNMANSTGTPTLQFGQKYYYNILFAGNNSVGQSYSATWSPTVFSCGFWMSCTDLSPGGHVFGNFANDGSYNYHGFTFRVQTDGTLLLYIADGGSGEGTNNASTAKISTNTWYNVICTYNGTTTSNIYVNGVLWANKTNHNTINTSTDTKPRIGCRVIYTGNDRFYKGYVDDAWMCDYVLSAADVKRRYFYSIGKYE